MSVLNKHNQCPVEILKNKVSWKESNLQRIVKKPDANHFPSISEHCFSLRFYLIFSQFVFYLNPLKILLLSCFIIHCIKDDCFIFCFGLLHKYMSLSFL